MTISNTSIYTDVYSAVRTVLVAANLQITNSTTSATTNASIAAAYNDKKQSSPQVTIQVDKSEGPRYKFGSEEGKKAINVTIMVYATTTLYVDQLKEQIEVAMKAASFDDLMLVAIDVDNSFTNPNEAKYHSSTLTFTYDRE